MNIPKRLVIFVFILLIILLVGMLFWPFILKEIIIPTSLAVWLLLRIFVLSIDQKYYLGAIIFIMLFLLYRLLPQDQPSIQSGDSQNSNATMQTIGIWHSLITLSGYDTREDKNLKRELIRLLLLLNATKKRTSADYELYEALQRGEISIPEDIHDFLFLEEPLVVGHSLKKRIRSIGNIPRKWIRRWTGQETAEHYRMVDEVLCFIETSLEVKNDDGKINPNKH
jgi:hypothetical protein